MQEKIEGRYASGEMRFAAGIFLVVLCGCDRAPDYPVPAQSPAVENVALPGARVVEMEEPGLMLRVVRDISPDLTSNWRWGFQRPALRLRVRETENLKFVIDYAVPEITFKDTGPVTIAFSVNDHVLDRVRVTAPGAQHFEKPVPAEWMAPDQDAIVGGEIDKMWPSPGDGKPFGFIITRMGLARR